MGLRPAVPLWPPPDEKDLARNAERQRLLLRLRAHLQQVVAEIAAVWDATQVLLEAQAQRPLTAAEAERACVLGREQARLYAALRHVRAEVTRLQDGT